MRNAQPGQTVPFVLSGEASGQAAALKVRLRSLTTNVLIVDLAAGVGIVEQDPGGATSNYTGTLTIPAGAATDVYQGEFLDGDGVTWPDDDLISVTATPQPAGAPPPGAYAAPVDLRDYCQDNPDVTVPNDDAAAIRLLARASSDLDSILGGYPVLSTGRKLDPANAAVGAPHLSPTQIGALNRAACAQAEYRLTMGEDFFAKPQADSVQGPDFTVKGKLPKIAPKALVELRGQAIVNAWTQAAAGSIPPVRRGDRLVGPF